MFAGLQSIGAGVIVLSQLSKRLSQLVQGAIGLIPQKIRLRFIRSRQQQPPQANRGELAELWQELKQLQALTDHPRRIEILQQLLNQVSRDQNPEPWAELQGELGNSLQQCLQGDRATNIEEAIAAYEQALTVRTQEAMPVAWAQTLNTLAAAYADRIRGDRFLDIVCAIAS
ncbi:MAG: tetratricopeptide repeat protein, partial [Cyanothece sp. SIO2G6]|nr:tetratricopeptide repeat protein [Cyanothece sp. SIO2G6]